MIKHCVWCDEQFETDGHERKCPTCRSRKLYADPEMHIRKRHNQRMGRPSPEFRRSHTARS